MRESPCTATSLVGSPCGGSNALELIFARPLTMNPRAVPQKPAKSPPVEPLLPGGVAEAGKGPAGLAQARRFPAVLAGPHLVDAGLELGEPAGGQTQAGHPPLVCLRHARRTG